MTPNRKPVHPADRQRKEQRDDEQQCDRRAVPRRLATPARRNPTQNTNAAGITHDGMRLPLNKPPSVVVCRAGGPVLWLRGLGVGHDVMVLRHARRAGRHDHPNTLDPAHVGCGMRGPSPVARRRPHRDLLGPAASGGSTRRDPAGPCRQRDVHGGCALLQRCIHSRCRVADHSDYRRPVALAPAHRRLPRWALAPDRRGRAAVACACRARGRVVVASDGRRRRQRPALVAMGDAPRSIASSWLTSATERSRSTPASATSTCARWQSLHARSACPLRPNPSAPCATRSVPSVPSCEAHQRRARQRATCCCSPRCTPRCVRCTRCSARPPWRCSPGGHAGRCACRHSRSWKPSPCGGDAFAARWALSGTPMLTPDPGTGDEVDLTAWRPRPAGDLAVPGRSPGRPRPRVLSPSHAAIDASSCSSAATCQTPRPMHLNEQRGALSAEVDAADQLVAEQERQHVVPVLTAWRRRVDLDR